MILLFLSAFFCYLVYREIRSPYKKSDGFSLIYILVLVALAIASARPAYLTWRLETMLSEIASVIAERPNVKVRCNSVFDTLFTGKGVSSPAGTAYYDTNEIFFESGWCKNFTAYLSNIENPSNEELFAMHLFTHEVMHIRGERSEKKTDCQAVQRNHTVGKLLGIDDAIAIKNAKTYYTKLYPWHRYYDKRCKPGGKLDENLPGSIWG